MIFGSLMRMAGCQDVCLRHLRSAVKSFRIDRGLFHSNASCMPSEGCPIAVVVLALRSK